MTTNTARVTINGAVLRDARINARIPTRTVAAAADITLTAVTAIEDTGNVTHLTTHQLARLAARVGLTTHQLLCTPTDTDTGTPTDGPSTDGNEANEGVVEVLGSILHTSNRPVSNTALTDALNLTPTDLDTHLTTLQHHLNQVGLTLIRTATHTQLVATPPPRTVRDAVNTAERRHDTRSHLTLSDTRILYAAYTGATEKALRANRNNDAQTSKLVNAGLLHPADNQTDPIGVDPDILYSLHPPDQP